MREVIVVSGLPRSGTSLMMSMLRAGGLELLVDQKRQADENNPRGYYEYEKTKRLQNDNTWLHEAEGKVIKVVSTLLGSLPAQYHYRVVFVRRRMPEILESQRQMLRREGKNAAADDATLSLYYANHLRKVEDWLGRQQNFSICTVSFNALFTLDVAKEMEKLAAFFGNRGLDMRKMRSVIDKSLYRQRAEDISSQSG